MFAAPISVLMVVGLTQAAPQIGTDQVVSSVTAQLQPLIADAVAKALASTSSSFSSSSGFASNRNSGFAASTGAVAAAGLTPDEEKEYNRKLSANAAYDFGYKVADDQAQTYLTHDEVRQGENVQGTYSYVDATGDLVTVTYTAGPEGYNEERTVQENAVVMRNIPGPWNGPFAGVDEVAAPVQPVAPVVRPQLVRTPAPAPAAPQVDQAALIQQIISQLQPSISSAVESAISTRQASAARSSVSSGSSATSGFFGGENSVRIETPQFNIQY